MDELEKKRKANRLKKLADKGCRNKDALAYLNEFNVICRFNLLTEQHEVTYAKKTYHIDRGTEFERLLTALTTEVKSVLPDKKILEDQIKGSAVRYDPCQEFYKQVKPKQNDTAAVELLFQCCALSIALYRAFVKQIAKRMQSPGCHAPHMLILKGEQGIGKSMLAQALGFGWAIANSLRSETKDVQRAIQGAVVCEAEELNWTRKDADKIKALISARYDHYDEKYMRAKKVPRRCLFVGTTNNDAPLPLDDQGRRFWIIYCEPTEEQDKPNWDDVEQIIQRAVLADLAHAKWELEQDKLNYLTNDQAVAAEERYHANTFADDSITNLLEEHGWRCIRDCKSHTAAGFRHIKTEDLIESLAVHYELKTEHLYSGKREITTWMKRKGYKYRQINVKGKSIKAWRIDRVWKATPVTR